MHDTADVIIIGGGIMGASTAYHLAMRGGGKIVVLERAEQLGTGATGKNAGGIRHQFSTDVNIELSRRSIAMMERFADEMDQEIDLNFCGYLFLLSDPEDVTAFRANVARQNALGVPSEFLDLEAIARRVPSVRLDGVLGGTFCPRDGLVDPHGMLQGYVTQARRRGVVFTTERPVTGISIEADRVRGVETPDGPIAGPVVVIAAGPWAGEVGTLAGIDLPVRAIRRQMAVTAPLAGITPDFPFTIDFSDSLYFHYESGGMLTGMSNPQQEAGFDETVDDEWRLVHLEKAMARMPMLESAELLTEWAGLYEVTPDDQPILGRLPIDGLYAITGFSGHGLMHGPIAGLLLAEEILDGRAATVDIDTLRYQRFERANRDREANVI